MGNVDCFLEGLEVRLESIRNTDLAKRRTQCGKPDPVLIKAGLDLSYLFRRMKDQIASVYSAHFNMIHGKLPDHRHLSGQIPCNLICKSCQNYLLSHRFLLF